MAQVAGAGTPTTPGSSLEGMIGTAGSLSILGALLYYLITKHNPRQDERYDAMVKGHSDKMEAVTIAHTENLDKAFTTFRTEMAEQRVHNEKSVERLCESISHLADKKAPS
jgi:hypothetical protein